MASRPVEDAVIATIRELSLQKRKTTQGVIAREMEMDPFAVRKVLRRLRRAKRVKVKLIPVTPDSTRVIRTYTVLRKNHAG